MYFIAGIFNRIPAMIRKISHQQFPVPRGVGGGYLKTKRKSPAQPRLKFTAQTKKAPAAGNADINNISLFISKFKYPKLSTHPGDLFLRKRAPGFIQPDCHDSTFAR